MKCVSFELYYMYACTLTISQSMAVLYVLHKKGNKNSQHLFIIYISRRPDK